MEQFFNLKLLIIIFVVGNAVVVLASIFYRAWKGKKNPAIPEFDITFSEKWVSGFSHQTSLTKLGGATNCLAVELSRKALVIRSMLPLSLGFLAKFYDLEHHIPKDKIKRVQPKDSDGKGRVVIDFEQDGVEKRVELILRKRQEFLRAFGVTREPQPVPSGILT
ncbi:MAG TPA: hypothetical protein VF766_04585 [Pyrinomonadaceae bacterium]